MKDILVFRLFKAASSEVFIPFFFLPPKYMLNKETEQLTLVLFDKKNPKSHLWILRNEVNTTKIYYHSSVTQDYEEADVFHGCISKPFPIHHTLKRTLISTVNFFGKLNLAKSHSFCW